METDILKTLRELKHIVPSPDYAKHSRMLILASPQKASLKLHADTERIGTFFRLSAILGLGIVGIFVILGGTTYINETYSPLALEGLSQRSLVAEADEINDTIEITLETIDFLDTSNQTVLKKITEVSKTNSTEPAAATMTMAAFSPSATSTDMDSFLIKSDSTAEPAKTELIDINTVLEKVSE